MARQYKHLKETAVSKLIHCMGKFADAARPVAHPSWGAPPLGFHLACIRIPDSPFSDFQLRIESDEPTGTGLLGVDPGLMDRLYGAWRTSEIERGALDATLVLKAPAMDGLLPDLAATGQLVRADDPGRSLVLDPEMEPWQLALRIDRDPATEGFAMTGLFLHGASTDASTTIDHWTDLHLHPHGWLCYRDQLARFRPEEALWIKVMMEYGGRLVIPKSELLSFLEDVGRSMDLPRLLDTHHLPFQMIQGVDPVPVLKTSEADQGLYAAKLFFEYGGRLIPEPLLHRLSELRDARGHREGYAVRNRAAESRRVDELRASGFHGMGDAIQGHLWSVEPEQAPDAFEQLIAAGWRIETDAGGRAGGAPVRNPEWSFRIESGIDWFDLQGVQWGEGESVLTANVMTLLECIAQRRVFVKLNDGSNLLITREMKRVLSAVGAAGQRGKDVLRLQSSLASMLFSMHPTSPDNDLRQPALGKRLMAAAAERLRNFDGIRPRTADPAVFKGTLRAYQQEGLGWLYFLRDCSLGGCLADDMGLGKTVQVIALLADHHRSRDKQPSLVVAPITLLDNWFSELARFAPQLRVLKHHGPARSTMIPHFDRYDIIVSSYGVVNSDLRWLGSRMFDYVILDEAHQIRNPGAKSSRAVKALQARHRLAMTGTPVINYGRDLKSIFDFLSPGLCQSIPDIAGFLRSGGPLSEEEARKVGQYLRPFILRRKKDQVLTELPSKTETLLQVELGDEERRDYNSLRDNYRSALLQGIRVHGMQHQHMHVLAALMRLRQLACHPGILDPERIDQGSAKLDTLLNELEQMLAENHKVLVFSNFTSHLDILHRHLQARTNPDSILYLSGQTSEAERSRLVKAFQTDAEKKIFLISIKAGGLGLNLTAADYVFIADPWWNKATENQAIDRVHRIGQKNPVFAYRLIARGTIEEKMLQLQERKAEVANLMIDQQGKDITKLTMEELEFLLT